MSVADGPHKVVKLDKNIFEKIKDEYYTLRGWDVQTGVSTRKKLKELGLKDVVDKLDKLN